jgi:FkbM family methyltransferase
MKFLNYLHKFKLFLLLSGDKPEDIFFIQIAKLFFLPLRLLTKKNLGLFLFKDVIAKVSYGKFFCRKKSEDLGIISESFESEIFSIFKPKEGDIVVDCGAHIGKYTIYASKLVGSRGKVLAIEPEPRNFEILNKNCQINHCKNVILLKNAVWDSDKELKLFITNAVTEHSLKRVTQNFIKVRALKLDTLLGKLKLEKVDWLKIDAEGAEIEVLKGAKKYLTKGKIKNIIIESEKPKELLPTIKKLGYSVKQIYQNYYLFTKV